MRQIYFVHVSKEVCQLLDDSLLRAFYIKDPTQISLLSFYAVITDSGNYYTDSFY